MIRFKICLISIIFFLLFSMFLTACNSQPTVSNKHEIIMGVSLAREDPDLYKLIKEAMYDNQKRDNVKIIWKGAENSQQQTADIENFIKQKVDAIIIYPLTSGKYQELIKKIDQKDIPVISIGKIIDKVRLDGFVTNNYFEAGMKQAIYLGDQIEHQGKIMILKGSKDSLISRQMTDGNKEILLKEQGINLVTERWHQAETAEEAVKTTYEALEEYPDLKGIIANSSELMMGAIKVLKEKNLTDKVVTVGFGATRESIKAIVNGNHDAEIDNAPYLLGLTAFKIACEIVRGNDWLYDIRFANEDYKVPTKIVPNLLINKYNLILMERRYGSGILKKDK